MVDGELPGDLEADLHVETGHRGQVRVELVIHQILADILRRTGHHGRCRLLGRLPDGEINIRAEIDPFPHGLQADAHLLEILVPVGAVPVVPKTGAEDAIQTGHIVAVAGPRVSAERAVDRGKKPQVGEVQRVARHEVGEHHDWKERTILRDALAHARPTTEIDTQSIVGLPGRGLGGRCGDRRLAAVFLAGDLAGGGCFVVRLVFVVVICAKSSAPCAEEAEQNRADKVTAPRSAFYEAADTAGGPEAARLRSRLARIRCEHS